MSDNFYRRLDAKEQEERLARIFRHRPGNLHDYQGCANDAKMQPVESPKELPQADDPDETLNDVWTCDACMTCDPNFCNCAVDPVEPVADVGGVLPLRPETYIDGHSERIKPGETAAAVRYISALETENSELKRKLAGETAWIEIKEGCEMPKNGHDVLIWLSSVGLRHGYYFAVSSPIDGWYVRGNLVEDKVTHWQPLPSPPEATQ